MKTNFGKLVLKTYTKGAGFLYISVVVPWLAATPCMGGMFQTTLAQFTFEHSQPNGQVGARNSYPSFAAEAGNGTGTGTAWHQNTCNYLDYIGNDSDHSFCSSNWMAGDYWQFECSSRGASDIHLSFDLVGSRTAPKYFQLLYSTDGSTFINPDKRFRLFGWFYPGKQYQYTLLTNGTLGGFKTTWSSVFCHGNTHYTADLSSFPALNNAARIYCRLVDASGVSISNGIVGPCGIARVDNFIISGTESSATARMAWAQLPRQTYGRALDGRQLNASASMPGAFEYLPRAGTVLNAGTNTLTAIFTPTNRKFSSVTNTMALVVTPTPLVVSAFNAARTAGTTNSVFSGSIYGLVNGDKITATYNCNAKNDSRAGDYDIIPALNDPDSRLANYSVSTNFGMLTVSTGAVEEVILAQWNFNNTNLPSAALAGGTWYKKIPAQLGSGTATGWHRRRSLYLTLSDGTNYGFGSTNWVKGDFWQFETSRKMARDISVVWHQASTGSGPMTFKYTIGEHDNDKAGRTDIHTMISIPCNSNVTDAPPVLMFALSAPQVLSMPGEATNVLVRFTDDSSDGAGGGRAGPIGANMLLDVTIYGAVPMSAETPVISWTPLPLNSGMPLGPAQLNAAANTRGTFTYEPGTGTVLPAGINRLSVVFTPSDAHYRTITNMVSLGVNLPPTLYSSNRH